MTTLPLASNSNFAIIYIDIERFTNINETFGRAAGDILLCETASRLNQCLGEKGLLARIGADCFAFVYLDSHNGAKVAHLLENELANALTKPIRFLDQEIRVSTKAGIALFPADGLDAETILRGAEAALKSAKSTNSRYLFYNSIMNSRAAESLSIENRLRRALDEQQFVLYYQPKVNLKTGEIVGLEALIRWNEPDKGLIPPNQFIPILEETGLIVDVGYWVISKTHEQFKLWSHEGLNPPRIAVNVSQLQIRQRDFVKNVTLILHDLIAEEIEIEITESLFTENLEENIAKLDSLRKLGITVAIDDFGTGYSSLSYISKLPIDTLKIDRSFIKEMTTNPQQLAIVSTIISLGRSLDLKLVAEGVETKEEEAILKGYQCDEVQGYLISPPLHADKIPALLEKLKRNKVI